MKKYSGIPISDGAAFGKAFLFIDAEAMKIPRFRIEKNQIPHEWERFCAAIDETRVSLQKSLEMHAGYAEDSVMILQAHLMMLDDPDFHAAIKTLVETKLQNIECAVWEASQAIVAKLITLPDASMRERAVDIADIAKSILHCLLGVKRLDLEHLSEDVIIVADELLPSHTMSLDKNHVKAIVMDSGSRTSHTAILARAYGIPAVFGLSTITKKVTHGQMIMVNGSKGEVVINPTPERLAQYQHFVQSYEQETIAFTLLKDMPAETLDGRRIVLNANIEFPEEAEQVALHGGEGVGLYRSEFLFIQENMRSNEEEQFNAYRKVAETLGGKPVTIRTIDIGGDKVLPGLTTVEEKNPLLGWRAIRFSLAHPGVFKAQLRAILRAGMFGNVKILFPMISCIEELTVALALLEEARTECLAKGQAVPEQMEAGVMIEVPSAAVIADLFAERADFFSIGTNDLIQYTLAIDRNNERVSYLSNPFHPALIRLLKKTVDEAHRVGIKAAMCGELAGDTRATALLIGLGLDELSMTASLIPRVKKIIRENSFAKCQTLAEQILLCKTVSDAETVLKNFG